MATTKKRKRSGKVEFKKTTTGRWYWILKSGNGNKISRSSGGKQLSYLSKQSCIEGFYDTKELFSITTID